MRTNHLAIDPFYHPGLRNSVESSMDVSSISTDTSFGTFDNSTKGYSIPNNSTDLSKCSNSEKDSLEMSMVKIVDPMLILQRGLDELRQTLTSTPIIDVESFDDVIVRKKAKMSAPIVANRKQIGKRNEKRRSSNVKQNPIVIEF